MGSGQFVGPKTIEVALAGGGTRTFIGENVVINTGTRATIDPIPGLLEAGPLTHIEALELDQVPGISSSWAAATSGSSWRRRCAVSAAA